MDRNPFLMVIAVLIVIPLVLVVAIMTTIRWLLANLDIWMAILIGVLLIRSIAVYR